MFESLLNVKYLTSKNCLCSLSAKNFKHLQNNFVKLVYNDDNESSYVSVDSSSGSIDDQSIGINSLFAKALGIDDNSFLAVSEIPRPPTIQTVGITTIDDDDHHVLESLAERVQSTLLEQIRVLSVGRKFIIWIGKTIHVTVTVCDIKPFSPGIIDNLSEVVIKPPEKESRQMLDHNKSEKQIVQKCRKETLHFLADYVDREENLILRVAPFVELIEKIGGPNHPFNVFVSKNYVPSYLKDTIISPKFFLAKLLNDENEEKFIYVRLYLFEDILHAFKLNKICFGNIFVSDVLMKHLNCDLGSRLLLQPYNSPLPEIQELEIYAKRNFSINISEHFKQYLADSCKDQEFVLNQNVILEVSDKLRCYVRFQPCEAKFCVVTPDFVRNCKLVTINESIPQKEEEKNEFSANKYTTDVANYQDIIDTCIFLFGFNTKVFCKMYNVLITGKSGTGKTTLVKIISHAIKSSPYFIYTKKINCKSIKGKTVESLHKLFTTILFDSIRHQPSVLILDNFQVLCENVNEGDALVQNGVYFNRASEMLEGLFQNFCEHNAVGILATAESTAKLNKNVYATRGNSLFKNVYNINQFDKSDRRQLLEFFFSSCTYDEVDLDKLAEKTESFVMQDLVDFANKTLFESYQEDCDQDVLKITTHHCEKALEIVTETSLAGVNLHPPGNRYLDDIGGLTDAKKILVEAMLWPAKYPNLFTNAPLRLAAGFLLYGPPGTGKTILAGAAAKHCGLRLISIKGPELLSKYIGASEQAVRDVFQRAQSAKPCILFFDEFDSLAPRRGHDNTGVTDRVVNQLLTQLDGIESLSGVFVLAATSRPDLLDPALLRPGRLDIHVRCSLPDEVSRVEILKVLSKSLKLASDVNLAELARATEGFSGADLQAVLYSAQLDSVKGLLEDEVEMQEFQSEIHQVQLEEALKHTRPSLSTAERMKYEHIYRIFENGGSSDFMPGSRATLA